MKLLAYQHTFHYPRGFFIIIIISLGRYNACGRKLACTVLQQWLSTKGKSWNFLNITAINGCDVKKPPVVLFKLAFTTLSTAQQHFEDAPHTMPYLSYSHNQQVLQNPQANPKRHPGHHFIPLEMSPLKIQGDSALQQALTARRKATPSIHRAIQR